jgi:ribosome maturation factor RimP
LERPLAGRKRFRGRLLGVEGEAVRLEQDGAPLEFPFSDIAAAKLVVATIKPGGGNGRGSGRRASA